MKDLFSKSFSGREYEDDLFVFDRISIVNDRVLVAHRLEK